MSVSRYPAKMYVCTCGERYLGYSNAAGQDIDPDADAFMAVHALHGPVVDDQGYNILHAWG